MKRRLRRSLSSLTSPTPLARNGEFVEPDQADLGSPVLFEKIFRFPPPPKSPLELWLQKSPVTGESTKETVKTIACGNAG
jgi:hypothetical protein